MAVAQSNAYPIILPHDSGGGRYERYRSRGALRTRVLQQERKPLMFRLQIKKGGGAPEGANRMGRTTRADVATCPRFGRGARHGRSAYANRPLRARSPFGAPPRLWPKFLGLGFSTSGQVSWDAALERALPAFACPSPADAPRAPAVIPADMMPEAARERFARPPAGTALAPLSGSHLESALVERDGGAISGDGDEGQARSANLFVRFSKPLKSNFFDVKQFDVKRAGVASTRPKIELTTAKIRKRSLSSESA